MIKAIFFDIGGILAIENRDRQYSRLAKIMNFDLKEFMRIRRKNVIPFAEGKISEKDYLGIFAKKLDLNLKDLRKNWIISAEKNFRIDKDVERMIKNLNKNYILGSLTNITPLHNIVRKKYGVYGNFKINLLSFEQGLMKPNINFYRLMIKQTGLKPEEIVFVDNYNSYLDPARNLKIKTILFKDKRDFVDKLKKVDKSFNK